VLRRFRIRRSTVRSRRGWERAWARSCRQGWAAVRNTKPLDSLLEQIMQPIQLQSTAHKVLYKLCLELPTPFPGRWRGTDPRCSYEEHHVHLAGDLRQQTQMMGMEPQPSGERPPSPARCRSSEPCRKCSPRSGTSPGSVRPRVRAASSCCRSCCRSHSAATPSPWLDRHGRRPRQEHRA
jgi:hypothetical protein